MGFRAKGLIRAFKHYDLHIVLFPSHLQILLPTSLPEQRAEECEADSARISYISRAYHAVPLMLTLLSA